LKKGLIKRACDGSSINVWEDSWIPVNRSMKPMFRDPEAKVMKVHELIDRVRMLRCRKGRGKFHLGRRVSDNVLYLLGDFRMTIGLGIMKRMGFFGKINI
jgi:hypothetical protein